jgi:putative aldouronate transport system substrate-binding protein
MVVYRSDWAKEAGLDAPDTIDGIYNMAKAFAYGDYDRNMQNDTIGFALGTVNNEIDCIDALVVAFGGFNRWGIKDGKVIPAFMTEEYLETLNWLRKMFDEGLISPDFAITKTTQIVPDFVDKEKTGLWLFSTSFWSESI